MLYKKLSKDENGSFILKEAETISLPKELFADTEKVSSANEKFKMALEFLTKSEIFRKKAELATRLSDMADNDVTSVSSMNALKTSIDTLLDLDCQLSGVKKPDNWYLGLAASIVHSKSFWFNGSDALIAAIKEASTNANYKSVRDALLEFGKNIVPTPESGIKPKKPSFRLNNAHDGRYSIEELIAVCTARKPKITKNGLKYQSPSDTDILYSALTELYYNCYNLPIKGKKVAKRPEKDILF